MDNKLSIFIDESGNIGSIKKTSKYYIITFVIHEQNTNITSNIEKIKNTPLFHAGPLIRREFPFDDLNIKERKKIFQTMFIFIINLPIISKSFIYRKKDFNDDLLKMKAKICKDTYDYLMSNFEYFNSFSTIVIYYDNGQSMITNVLNSSFSISGLNYEFKRKVIPGNYRLFQVADFITMVKLLEQKLLSNELTKSESLFFDNKNLKRYIKSINKKEK